MLKYASRLALVQVSNVCFPTASKALCSLSTTVSGISQLMSLVSVSQAGLMGPTDTNHKKHVSNWNDLINHKLMSKYLEQKCVAKRCAGSD